MDEGHARLTQDHLSHRSLGRATEAVDEVAVGALPALEVESVSEPESWRSFSVKFPPFESHQVLVASSY